MIITIPCALGMGALGGPIIEMLFHPQSGVALSAGILQAGVPVIILYALSTLTTAILQGLGHLREPLIHCAAALVVHVIALFFMLRYANLNIYAVMYANIIFALVICLLNALSIRRYIAYRQEWRKTFLVPVIASIIMAFAAFAVYRLLHMFLGNTVCTVAAILAGMIVYAISLVAFHGMTRSELMKLPKGAMIVRVFEKMGLLR
jgi:stage V sporulation protein B